MGAQVSLDVRTIPPRERHPRIFQIIEQLDADEYMELTNDHDPKPLYYQIMTLYPDQFDWIYLEEGPEVWRVRIVRKAAKA